MTFYYVYVLKSLKHNFIYIGFTDNLKRRFKEHNSKLNISTKHYAPFEIIHYKPTEISKTPNVEKNI